MQLTMARALDAAAIEPLLPAQQSSTAAASGGARPPATAVPDRRAAARPAAAAPSARLHFVRRFTALMRLLRPYPALFLSLVAIGEAVVVAEVGKVAGSFYLIVVDGQPAKLAGAMLRAAALYAAATALYAAATWITEALALKWRERLTSHLHSKYCHGGHAYFFLQQPRPEPGQQQQEQQQQPQRPQPESPPKAGQAAVDNPDQRIAADAAQLCENLAAVARVAAATPFKMLYFSWLTGGYLGWKGLAAVFAFFWLAALVQRLAVAPVARLVFRQERREGDLRYAHLRLRQYAAEVAQYDAAAAERRHLDASLGAALANQRLLVRWRAVLAGATRAVDYAGALLNYFVVGAAVFAGMAGGDGGQRAQFVSNASFATLTLIYTFTELLDLSDKISMLGGLTARVGELLEALPGAAGDRGGRGAHDLHAVRLSLEGAGRELLPSQLATLLHPPRLFSCLGSSVSLEASVHLLGPDLQHEARAIFPDAPADGQLLACLTFQRAAGGVSLAPDSSGATLDRASAEMDRLLHCFLRWEAAVRTALAASRRWCDAVDPRNGNALHGSRGQRWSEVAAAHALLGYERRDAGICPLVLHPRFGSSAYPATLFTDASPEELEQALASVCDQGKPGALTDGADDGADGSDGEGAAGEAPAPLLSLRQLSVQTPAGALAVAELSLELLPGQHLLITGPNGCGKSTLVQALCGLHPMGAGSALLAGAPLQAVLGGGGTPAPRAGGGGSGVMFLPQRPLAAPGGALWQQLCYPDDGGASRPGSGGSCARQCPPPDGELLGLLQRVGLQYLLDRVGGSFVAAADWDGMLSPGELQRLAVARVLHRRPALAVLDEPTSAVSEAAAEQLYGQLHAAGITCVSVGQDSGHLRRLHRRLLLLGCGPTEGAWRMQPL